MEELKTLKDMNLFFSTRKRLEEEFYEYTKKDSVDNTIIKDCPMNVIGWFYGKRDNQIKQEAIKHIKNFRKPCKINILNKSCGHLEVDILKNNRAGCRSCGSIIEYKREMSPEDEPEVTFIKKFFNITEENLK